MKETPSENDGEISLIDLFAVIWRRRVMILVITLAAAAVAVAAAVVSLLLPPEESFLPNRYTPQALMLINDSKSSGGGLSSMLASSGLSGLASMAGVNVSGGGQTYSELAKYLIATNTFLDAVVDGFDLVTRYKIKKFPRAESRKALKKLLLAEYDEKSGVLSISFTDLDPAFAQEVVNFSVNYLERWFQGLGLDKNVLQKANLEQNIANTFEDIRRLEEEGRRLEYTVSAGGNARSIPSIMLASQQMELELEAQKEVYKQLKVQLEMLKVTLASESPIFQILERAEVPDQKSEPSRGLICIIIVFAAGFFAVFLAFVRNALENIRGDPEAMAKLRGNRE